MREVTVTQVLRRLYDLPKIDPDIIKNKGEIGKDVHSAIEAHIKGEWFPLEEDRRIAYFDSYGQWMPKADMQYKITEKRYYDNDLFLSGQVDAVVTHCNCPALFLLDFKTSANESFTRDGMSAWNMQGHLYLHLLRKNGIDVSDEIIFLQLKTKKTLDGYVGVKPKEYLYTYDQAIMNRCLEEVHKYWEEFDSAKENN